MTDSNLSLDALAERIRELENRERMHENSVRKTKLDAEVTLQLQLAIYDALASRWASFGEEITQTLERARQQARAESRDSDVSVLNSLIHQLDQRDYLPGND